jgi:hypothetical protein
MANEHGRAAAHDVLVPPCPQGAEHGPQISALRGQLVLEALGALLVAAPLEDPVLDEPSEAVAEDRAREPEPRLEVGEAPDADGGLAQDQQRPAVADDLERRGDGAVLVGVGARQDPTSVA